MPEPEGAERSLSEVDRLLVEAAARQDPEEAGEAAADATTANADERPERDPWATAWTELDLRCGPCNIIHYVPVCTFLNARESPELLPALLEGRLNTKRCPVCHKTELVDYPFTYFDPTRKLAVQVRSAWEWHAGGGEEWYAARLEDFFERWAVHDVRIDVVFGQEQLVERFLRDEGRGAQGESSAGE